MKDEFHVRTQRIHRVIIKEDSADNNDRNYQSADIGFDRTEIVNYSEAFDNSEECPNEENDNEEK